MTTSFAVLHPGASRKFHRGETGGIVLSDHQQCCYASRCITLQVPGTGQVPRPTLSHSFVGQALWHRALTPCKDKLENERRVFRQHGQIRQTRSKVEVLHLFRCVPHTQTQRANFKVVGAASPRSPGPRFDPPRLGQKTRQNPAVALVFGREHVQIYYMIVYVWTCACSCLFYVPLIDSITQLQQVLGDDHNDSGKACHGSCPILHTQQRRAWAQMRNSGGQSKAGLDEEKQKAQISLGSACCNNIKI